jgi:thiol-disulfide isomerase/thioredoxin
MLILSALLVLLVPAGLLAQSSNLPGCRAETSIQAEIDRAKEFRPEEGRPYSEVQKEQAAKLKALLEKRPDNFFLHKAYIEVFPASMGGSKQVMEEYKKRAQAKPEDTQAQYLYARALMGHDTPESIRILTKLVDQHPDFPAALGTLGIIYGSPSFRDNAKRTAVTEAFFRNCADTVDAYTRLSGLPVSPLQRGAAPRLRKMLTGRTDDEALTGWPVLWRLEFKTTPIPEHDKLREQIRKDLAALKQVDAEKHRQVRSVLAEGYRTLGDKEGEKAALALMRGSGTRQVFDAMGEWSKKNPYPKPGDPEDKKHAYYEARYKASEEWVKMAPEEAFFLLDRARTVAELKDHSDSEFLALVDKYFELQKKKTSSVSGGAASQIEVAGLYAKRGVRLDEVPKLVQEGIEAHAKMAKSREGQSDLYGSSGGEQAAYMNHYNTKAGRGAVLDAYLKQKHFDKARETVVLMERELADWRKSVAGWEKKLAALPKDKPRDFAAMMMDSAVKGLPGEEASFQESLAKLAAAENRKLDALSFYQAALRSSASGNRSQRDLLTVKAQALWKELSGTGEGWQSWLSQSATPVSGSPSKPADAAWAKMERALPEFELTDMKGKTWKKTELAGKTVFVNLWATWCGPCREELPHLEKLYQRIKDRQDVMLLTLNLDDNIGAVEPFLKENKYSFPVLLAKDMAESFLGMLSIPRNWVVDRTGVLRYEMIGFDMTGGEEWIKKMTDQVELVRGGS